MPPIPCAYSLTAAEKEIPVSELKINDLFVMRPGENFAADGVVVNGSATVNEASVTGESMPVDKAVGDKVISGTSNLDGFITVRADKVGDDTTLAGIVKLVEDASASKAPIAKTADKNIGTPLRSSGSFMRRSSDI